MMSLSLKIITIFLGEWKLSSFSLRLLFLLAINVMQLPWFVRRLESGGWVAMYTTPHRLFCKVNLTDFYNISLSELSYGIDT